MVMNNLVMIGVVVTIADIAIVMIAAVTNIGYAFVVIIIVAVASTVIAIVIVVAIVMGIVIFVAIVIGIVMPVVIVIDDIFIVSCFGLVLLASSASRSWSRRWR